jgi:hypothetical protein
MPNTFTLISAVTVGAGGTTSIDFNSIPQTYTDLVIKGGARFSDIAGVSQPVSIKFNTLDTDQTWLQAYGNGSTVGSNGSTGLGQAATANGTASTTSSFSSFELYIPNYTGSQNKLVSTDTIVENAGTASSEIFSTTRWATSSAITSLSLVPNTTGTFAQYTTAYLYGISNA